MSFILDALKKSEAARQRQVGPGLIEPGFMPQRRGLPLWAIALLILFGINLIVLSVILVLHATRAPATPAASVGARADRPLRRRSGGVHGGIGAGAHACAGGEAI